MGRSAAQELRRENQKVSLSTQVHLDETGSSGQEPSDLLTPADAAKILNVSENDVLAVIAEGSLKGKKIGTSWRIGRSSIDEFLRS